MISLICSIENNRTRECKIPKMGKSWALDYRNEKARRGEKREVSKKRHMGGSRGKGHLRYVELGSMYVSNHSTKT